MLFSPEYEFSAAWIGPDVVGGAGPGKHSYGNPAQTCYLKIMVVLMEGQEGR